MVTVKGFRGIRYNPGKIGDFGKVLADICVVAVDRLSAGELGNRAAGVRPRHARRALE